MTVEDWRRGVKPCDSRGVKPEERDMMTVSLKPGTGPAPKSGWLRRRWSWERLETLPGLGIGLCLVTVLLYQVTQYICNTLLILSLVQVMNVMIKKVAVHPFILLLWRDCLLTPQVNLSGPPYWMEHTTLLITKLQF